MRLLTRFIHLVDTISEKLGNLTAYLVLLTVAVGLANVLLRYLGRFIGLRLTSNFFIELQWYLYSLVFLLGFAYILKHNINVRVDFWYGRQSPRRKMWIDLIGHLVALIPFCLLALAVTLNPVLLSWGRLPNGGWGTWELSPDPNGLPRAPIKSMILVAFVTLLLQGIVEVIRLITRLRGDDSVGMTTAEKADQFLPIE